MRGVGSRRQDRVEPVGCGLTERKLGPTDNSVYLECSPTIQPSDWFQATNKDCAVNSIANACMLVGRPLPESQYTTLLHSKGGLCTLHDVSGYISGMPGRGITLYKVPCEDTDLLSHLLVCRTGVFALECNGHCGLLYAPDDRH